MRNLLTILVLFWIFGLTTSCSDSMEDSNPLVGEWRLDSATIDGSVSNKAITDAICYTGESDVPNYSITFTNEGFSTSGTFSIDVTGSEKFLSGVDPYAATIMFGQQVTDREYTYSDDSLSVMGHLFPYTVDIFNVGLPGKENIMLVESISTDNLTLVEQYTYNTFFNVEPFEVVTEIKTIWTKQ